MEQTLPDRGTDGNASDPPTAARAELVALIRLAAIDREASRLRSSFHEITSLLDRKQADLAAFGALIETVRPRVDRVEDGSREATRNEPHRSDGTHAELAQGLERDRADGLRLSSEIQRRIAEFEERRQTLAGRVSPSLLGQYEATVREGRVPAVAAARDGACSACGALIEAEVWRRVREGGLIVACSGCARLLHDASWLERDFMPLTLRPLTKGQT